MSLSHVPRGHCVGHSLLVLCPKSISTFPSQSDLVSCWNGRYIRYEPQSNQKPLCDLLALLVRHAPEVEVVERIPRHLGHDREREIPAWKWTLASLHRFLVVHQMRHVWVIGISKHRQSFQLGSCCVTGCWFCGGLGVWISIRHPSLQFSQVARKAWSRGGSDLALILMIYSGRFTLLSWTRLHVRTIRPSAGVPS